MKRRSFLASSLAAGAFGASSARLFAAGTNIKPVSVVITDVTADTEPEALSGIVDPFLENGIWLTCAVRLPKTALRDAELAGTLSYLSQRLGGVEVAIDLPDLSRRSPYFQARAVFDARERLLGFANMQAADLPVRCVLCDEYESPMRPTGVRSSGIRNVLVRPKTSSPVRSETWENGVVRFFGGSLADTKHPEETFANSHAEESAHLIFLSVRELSLLPEPELKAWANNFAKDLANRELLGQLSSMTASDLQFRDDFRKKRLIAVCLEVNESRSDALSSNVEAFRQELSNAGIPATLKPQGETFWLNRNDEPSALLEAKLECKTGDPAKLLVEGHPDNGFLLTFVAAGKANYGLDDCGAMRLPELVITPDSVPLNLLAGELADIDICVLLSEDVIGRRETWQPILKYLVNLRNDAITQHVSLTEFAAKLHTYEPVAIRHRLTRAAKVGWKKPSPPKWNAEQRKKLLDDAATAWGYFEKYTERATGLCPATVNLQPGGEIHRAVTMWDVGSNLNGLVAAAELGLIDRKQAEARFRKILPNLAGRVTDGVRLPQGWIRTDRHRWGIRDFDGCDGGRLLSALDHMRRRFGMKKEVDALVASWNLDKIVVDKKVHSVIGRELRSTFSSHCAHYSALAFRRWGFDVASPYETLEGNGPGDGEVAMLEAVARIGPLGAEPLLLEAMEMEMSGESAYLADVLFYAMEEEFSESGRLICVSETPIDQEPWFIYQGLELGSGPRSWRLDTVGHQPEYLTDTAADTYLTFSTKAAFLWAAYRPTPFSAKLLDFARRSARNSAGFASGVNLANQRVMSGYSDLNTNAIILQAVARMLQ